MKTEMNASHGTIDEMKEKLAKDLKVIVADADDLLKEVSNSTLKEFAAARTKIEYRLGEARSRLDDARDTVTEKAKCAADSTYAYAKENPWKTLGVAAAGLVIAVLLSRR